MHTFNKVNPNLIREMGGPKVFIAFDGDGIGQLVGRAVLTDDVEALRSISQAIERGEEIIKSWAIENHGSVIEAGGDEATIEVPVVALSGIEGLRAKYFSATSATLSAGIGNRLSHAAKALMASKLRGKNQATFYDESVETEVAAAAEHPKSESEKIAEEYLNKTSGGSGRNLGNKDQPDRQEAPSEQGMAAEIYGSFRSPRLESSAQAKGAEDAFHRYAQKQEQHEKAVVAQKRDGLKDIKAKVAESLTQFKVQIPVFQQLQQVSPEAYQSVMGIVQGLILLGRTIQESEEKIEKAIIKPVGIDPLADLRKMLATATAGAEDMIGISKDELPGGKADNKTPADFDADALEIGTSHEMEHVNDRDIAQEIAMDHLAEDPNYYDEELSKLMEEEGASPATKVGELDKANINEKIGGQKKMYLPVGTTYKNRMKVRHFDGTEGWKSLKAGQIQGKDPGVPLFGANSHPVSSKDPNSS